MVNAMFAAGVAAIAYCHCPLAMVTAAVAAIMADGRCDNQPDRGL